MTFVSDTVFLSVPDWMSGQTLTLQGVFFLWSALMSTSYFVLSWNSFLPDGFHERYMYFMYCSSSMFPVHPVWILGEQAISSPWLCLSGVSLQPSNQFCDHLFLNDDFILFSFFFDTRYSKRLSIEFFVNLLSDSVHCFLLKMYYNCLRFAYYCLSRDLHFYFYSPTKFRLYFRTECLCTSVCLSVFCLDVLSCSSVLSFVTLFS